MSRSFETVRLGLPELGDDQDVLDWLVLNGDRLAVAGVLLLGVFALLAAIELVLVPAVGWPVPLLYVYSAQAGGNLTLITLVLSINQLILSRQLNSPGELREEMREVTDFREAVQKASEGDVAPVTPSDFLAQLLKNTDSQIETLREIQSETVHEELRQQLDDLATGLGDHIEEVTRLLSQNDVGTFEALSATLDSNYGEHIHRAQVLAAEFRQSFSEDEHAELDELVTRLRRIDVARQYFKTLFMQSELASLSRILLYVGFPAEIISTVMLFVAAGPGGQSFYTGIPSLVIAATIAVGFAPLAILFAFVVRIATVAQRSAAITPFTTHEQHRH